MIFCVIPSFNEKKNISAVTGEVAPLVDRLIVVDDCSTDNTADLAAARGAIVLKHIVNRGQGAALRTGTEYCLKQGAEIIVHFDADGQFLSSDIAKLAAPIKNGQAQAVFGSRFIGDNNTRMPWLKKHFIMPLARGINKIFFGINLTDPQSGFRALSAEAARAIKWRQDRMAHCSEIMFEVKRNKLKVKEVPITVIYHGFGQSFSGGLKILKDLFIAMLVN
ncbi:MAG: glycosyltransferase family 2 protein [bacterium]|nr:glycosyltransferase family 2 protein [bacterium]